IGCATMAAQLGCASSVEINASPDRVWNELPTVAQNCYLHYIETKPSTGRFDLSKFDAGLEYYLHGTVVVQGKESVKVTAITEWWSGFKFWTLLLHARDEETEQTFLQSLKLASEKAE